MRSVRTWLPVAIIVAGLLLMVLVRDENGLEGGVLLIASGLSVWMLNWFYLVSVRGERDRDVEDEARDFFDEHGHWPDEEPPPGTRPPAPPRPRREPPRHVTSGEDPTGADAPARRARTRPDRRPRRPSA